MKFYIGDRVRIKDLKDDEAHGGFYVVDEMLEHCGKVTEIIGVNSIFNDSFKLKDCGLWWFHEDMLELVKDDEECVSGEECISKGKDDSIFETENTKEKTSLEKALELLNMTEEEVNREYHRRKYVPLAEEIEEKSRNRCWECNRNDDSCDVCEILFTIEYLKEKGLLKDEL